MNRVRARGAGATEASVLVFFWTLGHYNKLPATSIRNPPQGNVINLITCIFTWLVFENCSFLLPFSVARGSVYYKMVYLRAAVVCEGVRRVLLPRKIFECPLETIYNHTWIFSYTTASNGWTIWVYCPYGPEKTQQWIIKKYGSTS